MNCIHRCLHEVRVHVSTSDENCIQSRDGWVKLRIDAMLEELFTLDACERCEILGKGLNYASSYLLGITRGMSEQALTHGNDKYLNTAILALIAEGGTRDQRESCQKFAMIEHSAKFLNIDIHDLIEKARCSDYLHSKDVIFVDTVLRIQVGQHIEQMGYELLQDERKVYHYKQVR